MISMAPLGRTGLRVSRLGLGLGPIGGLYTAVGSAQAAETVRRAWQRGIRLYDTAPLYGNGLSERRAGAALAEFDRAELVLSTKVGRVLVPGGHEGEPFWADAPVDVAPVFDFSADGVHRSLTDSLRRLALERVDLLLLHDPDQHLPQALAEAYPELAALRAAGRVGAIGAGANSAATLAHLVRGTEGGLDCVLLAGRYTLLDQTGLDDLLPLCLRSGTAVIGAGVFNSGVLADPRRSPTYNYGPAPAEIVERALEIESICGRHGVAMRAAAIQFPLAHPAVACVLVGARSPAEVDDAVAMLDRPIPSRLWTDLKAAGLLRDEAPTP
jgi:D-threo-aldose 1-dehydrogenase